MKFTEEYITQTHSGKSITIKPREHFNHLSSNSQKFVSENYADKQIVFVCDHMIPDGFDSHGIKCEIWNLSIVYRVNDGTDSFLEVTYYSGTRFWKIGRKFDFELHEKLIYPDTLEGLKLAVNYDFDMINSYYGKEDDIQGYYD